MLLSVCPARFEEALTDDIRFSTYIRLSGDGSVGRGESGVPVAVGAAGASVGYVGFSGFEVVGSVLDGDSVESGGGCDSEGWVGVSDGSLASDGAGVSGESDVFGDSGVSCGSGAF